MYEIHLLERRAPTSDPYNAAEPKSKILERHTTADVERMAWLVQHISQCGLTRDQWIEVHPVPDEGEDPPY